MVPFNQNVLLWRLSRGLKQSELADRARLPRPNLSAIERGQREVSLKTIRALAAALEVRAGILVDGISPAEVGKPVHFSREKMERIAKAAALNKSLANSQENFLAQQLSIVTSNAKRKKISSRQASLAWLKLGHLPKNVRQSLIARTREQERFR